MPLNTFARLTVEEICGRAAPRLSPPELPSDPGRVFFPNGTPRRFEAAELVLAWIAAPERWENVRFILASHEQLRSQVLGLPLFDASGRRLKYVSPKEIEESSSFWNYVDSLRSDSASGNPQLSELVEKLYTRYALFRKLTYTPAQWASMRSELAHALAEYAGTWRSVRDEWQRLETTMGDKLNQAGISLDPAIFEESRNTLHAIAQIVSEGKADFNVLEEQLRLLRRQSDQIAQSVRHVPYSADTGKGTNDSPREATQNEQSYEALFSFAIQAEELAYRAAVLQNLLYDSNYSLHIVPSLDPATCAKRRIQAELQPWLSLCAVLYASQESLDKYSWKEILRVRQAWKKLSTLYVQQQSTDRQQVEEALASFAAAVRALGSSINTVRDKLSDPRLDDALLASTAYPPPDTTLVEVHYYELNPFLWAWVFLAAALFALLLAIGPLKRVLYWTGMVLLATGLFFITYGFALRVVITGWAPVTNMFESILFVSFVVGFLGMLFALEPWYGSTWRLAWHTATLPTKWLYEIARTRNLSNFSTWHMVLLAVQLVLAVALVVLLCVMRYGRGNAPLIPLVPSWAGGSAFSLEELTVWLVRIAVVAVLVWFVPRILTAIFLFAGIALVAPAQRSWKEIESHVLKRQLYPTVAAAVALLAALIAYYAPLSGKHIGNIAPVLRDNFWLTVHVLTITASYGAGAMAWGLANVALVIYFLGKYEPSDADISRQTARSIEPPLVPRLASFIYRAMQLAVLLLAVGTIFGALWADVAWGRFWNWDPKEVWALISLLVYIVVLHARYVGWVRNFGLIVGAVAGATAILIAWYGVNFVIRVGLHSYGQGSGGLPLVATALAANWLLVAAAAVRYRSEQSRFVPQKNLSTTATSEQE